MQNEATSIVSAGALGAKLEAYRAVEMRYEGQGHEISVPLPKGELNSTHARKLRADYEARYERQFRLRIADVPVEFLTWSVNVSTVSKDAGKRAELGKKKFKITTRMKRKVFNPNTGTAVAVAIFQRQDLAPGMQFAGPALVAEPQTTTLVPRGWHCSVTPPGHLLLVSTKP